MTIEPEKLKNIKEVLQEYFGSEKLLVDVELSRLNPPGENYLSFMVKIDAVLKKCDSSAEENFHAVAKCISEFEFSKDAFFYTYESELLFYTVIVPTLQDFLRENGKEQLDIFPKFIGARPLLQDENIQTDSNAVLVLENLKAAGFSNMDRYIGFDLDTATLVIRDLAAFHAIPLALKIKKPDVFQEKIRKSCTMKMPPPPYKLFNNVISIVCQVLEDYPKCAKHVSKIKSGMIQYAKQGFGFIEGNQYSGEPFATLSHFDMWVNNTMQKFQDGRPIKNKFVDFQMCLYESPAHDLLFFMFSSIRVSVLKDHFDHFIKLYHAYFIQHLKELHCDTSPFEWAYFLEEVEKAAWQQLFHVLFMTFVIFGKKGTDLDSDYMPGRNNKIEDLVAEVKDKMGYITEICIDKGWIV